MVREVARSNEIFDFLNIKKQRRTVQISIRSNSRKINKASKYETYTSAHKRCPQGVLNFEKSSCS
jgi:hypothetical protein